MSLLALEGVRIVSVEMACTCCGDDTRIDPRSISAYVNVHVAPTMTAMWVDVLGEQHLWRRTDRISLVEDGPL